MKLGKKSNFLIIYIGFFLLPIILLLSEKNIPQVTIVHLKLFFGAQLIILIIFSILSYLIFKILLPLLKINISLSDFLLINSFFIYLLFFYKQINSTFSPGSHKMMMDNLISILFYFIIYIIFFYFYIKRKKLFISFFLIYILINFSIFLFVFAKNNLNFENKIVIENTNKFLKINEIKNSTNKTDIFIIIFDGMLSLDYAEKIQIIDSKDDYIKQLNSSGFTYVENFTSNYIPSYLSIASILQSGFPVTENSKKYKNQLNFYPSILTSQKKENKFYKIIKNIKYKFVWAGNLHHDCVVNQYNICLSNFFLKDYLIKLKLLYADSIFVYFLDFFINNVVKTQVDAEKFLSDVNYYEKSKNLVNEKSIYLIHVLKPHPPFEFDKKCNKSKTLNIDFQPSIDQEEYFEKYKIAYNCSLKLINNWIVQKSKNKDEAVTFILGDHGWYFNKIIQKKMKDEYNLNVFDFRLSPFFAYKVPSRCKNLPVPKSSVNIMRFALNCTENLKLKFLEDKRYIHFKHRHENYGNVIEY